jgi:hypothetical protein
MRRAVIGLVVLAGGFLATAEACSDDTSVSPTSVDAGAPDAADASLCSAGQITCGGACVDPKTNAKFCGATGACQGVSAGKVCGGGQSCVDGACACPSTSPDACDSDGGVVCTNVHEDPAHCGSCTNSCGAGKVCSDGQCGVACASGQVTCGTGIAAVCHTPTGPADCCGVDCTADKECKDGCQPCVPTVTTVPSAKWPLPPADLKVDCLSDPCPVIRCGRQTFYAYSYLDNRESFGLIGYDDLGVVSKPVQELVGARYLQSITLNATDAGAGDAGAQTATLTGQAGSSVVVNWSALRF